MTRKKAFRIEGSFPMGHNKHQSFTKELVGNDKEEVKEMLLSLLGSEHGVKRRFVRIGTIKELRSDEVLSPLVKLQLGVE